MDPVQEGTKATRAQVRELLELGSNNKWAADRGPYTYLDPYFVAEDGADMIRRGIYFDNGERPGPLALRWDLAQAYRLTGSDAKTSEDWTLEPTVLFTGTRPATNAAALGTIHLERRPDKTAGSPYILTGDGAGGRTWREHRGNVYQLDRIRQRLRDRTWTNFPLVSRLIHSNPDNPQQGDHVITHATHGFHSRGRYIIGQTADNPGSIGIDQASFVSVLNKSPGAYAGIELRSTVALSILYQEATEIRPDVIAGNGRLYTSFWIYSVDGSGAMGLRFTVQIELLKDDVGEDDYNNIYMSIPALGINQVEVPMVERRPITQTWLYELEFDSGSERAIGRVDIEFEVVNDTGDVWSWYTDDALLNIEAFWSPDQGSALQVPAMMDQGSTYEFRALPTFKAFPGLAYATAKDVDDRIAWFRASQQDGVNSTYTWLDVPAESLVVAKVPPRGSFPRSSYFLHPEPVGDYYPTLAPCSQVSTLTALYALKNPVSGQFLYNEIPAADRPVYDVTIPVPLHGPFRGITRHWSEDRGAQEAPRGGELFPGRLDDLVVAVPHTIRYIQAHRIPSGDPRVLKVDDPRLEIMVVWTEKDAGGNNVPYPVITLEIPKNKSSSPPVFYDLVNPDGASVGYAVTNVGAPEFAERVNLEVYLAPMVHWATGNWLVNRDFLTVNNGNTIALALDEGFPRAELVNQTIAWLESTNQDDVVTEAEIDDLIATWPA